MYMYINMHVCIYVNRCILTAAHEIARCTIEAEILAISHPYVYVYAYVYRK